MQHAVPDNSAGLGELIHLIFEAEDILLFYPPAKVNLKLHFRSR